jgi:hypothetical protein
MPISIAFTDKLGDTLRAQRGHNESAFPPEAAVKADMRI